MSNRIESADAVSNPLLDLLLTFVTCGIYWLFFWRPRQFRVLNGFVGFKKYSMIPWFLLTIITFGIWELITQFRNATDIMNEQKKRGFEQTTWLPLASVLLSLAGLSWVVDVFHQYEMNEIYER
jgi:hypothetical protein